MSELVVGSIAGLASNSYEIDIASGSTLDLANAKAGSIPSSALGFIPGLVHISTESFSTVASVSLDDVFSADYKNYRVLISDIAGSASGDLFFKFRVSGSDTSTNYRFSLYGVRLTNTGFSAVNNGTTSIRIGSATTSAAQNKISFDVFSPFEAKNSSLWGGSFGGDATSYYGVQVGGTQTDSTSFDGLTVFPASGTINGVISVYAYGEA